jgi:hypothetical protein
MWPPKQHHHSHRRRRRGISDFLQSVDATVDQLPDNVDPRLNPVLVVEGERTYWKVEQNSLNGWNHRAHLVAEKTSSDILQGFDLWELFVHSIVLRIGFRPRA